MSLESSFQEVRFGPNRRRYAVALAGSAAFVVLGVALTLYSRDRGAAERMGTWISCALAITFFGLCGAFAAVRLFDRRPAIILTGEKLINNSAALQINEVLWSEMAYAEIIPSTNQRFLIIHLKDPETVLARQSTVVSKAQGANMSMYGSPILIAGSVLNASLEDLLVLVSERIRTAG